MTSEQFIWAWLPAVTEPVVCGRVRREGDIHLFQYGRSYLGHEDAVGLFGMPLSEEVLSPPAGMTLHGALRDGLPDAWGQHVILARLTGRSGLRADTAFNAVRLRKAGRPRCRARGGRRSRPAGSRCRGCRPVPWPGV
ncbi:HipA N-terminal domain-containing protein [Micropruina sp.]|uniref:HipA N-terminal domain-containing protein n=1 Tax=Micropruina sp. TaxID=2737536 RepID=UPI0034500273